MTCRWLLVLFSLVVAVPPRPSFGQASPGRDPISGKWTGTLTLQGRSSMDVALDLKLDDRGRVTGTFAGLPNPGDVKKGTFDAKTGAVQLQIGKEQDPAVLLTFDGSLAKDAITGTFKGEQTGTFSFRKVPPPRK